MRVKKYQAVDMPEALRKIKEELGPNAVILSTRQVKPGKGVFGLLGRPILEVTAAADVELPARAPARPSLRPEASAATPRPSADHGAYLALQADVESLREELSLLSRRAALPKQPSVPSAPSGDVLRGLQPLEEKLNRLLEQTARFDALKLAPGLRRLHRGLEARDLDPSLAARILAFLQEKIDQGSVAEGREVDAFRELVKRTVRVSGSLCAGGAGQRVVALLGPTGVGKTTTVAKLAARFALQEKKNVGLITVDTFRIAAVEQLRTYAKIMGVPLQVATDAGGLRSAVEGFSDRHLILVDTAGQSPQDEESLGELFRLLPGDDSVEVHLVLSITTRTRDLEKILKRYAGARPRRLLLTKLDETDCHGPLLGIPLASRLPLSYLTTGQNVPDDIEEATAEGVASYLARGLDTPEGRA